MKMKQLFITLLALWVSISVSAYDAYIDGIYYNLSGTEATVTYKSGFSYSGDVVIPSVVKYNGKTYSVTSIDIYAFECCRGLTSVTIPEGVTSIGSDAFYGCRGLTSITIPDGVTSIGDYAFDDCYFTYNSFVNNSSLSSSNTWGATLCDEETKDGLLIKDGVAVRCRPWATSVIIPNSVTSIGSSAFYGCSGLTSVTIPNSVTSIGDYAFDDCYFTYNSFVNNSSLSSSNTWGATLCDEETKEGFLINDGAVIIKCRPWVTSATIPEGVTSIGDHAFSRCYGLTSVTIPNSVSSIGEDAFYYCTGLTSVTIPESVAWIGNRAFDGCKLRNLSVRRETPPNADTNSFSEQTQYHTTLYIPVGAWDAYAYDNAWYKFINIRETAMESSNVAPENAYTLMNAKDFTYAVYDPVNNCVGTVSSVGVNEDNPNHCWQTVEVSGKKFLYNIGAKKFAVPATDGSSFTLSETVGSVEMTDGTDGIVLNGHTETQWALVLNESMNTDKTVEDVIVTAIEEIEMSNVKCKMDNGIYDLNGRRISDNSNFKMQNSKLKKGIYIVNGKRVLIR